ncbi:MAG: ABC-type branched-subunit amino acid transport system substrate-binding protein, partial [Bradymonadia bacterium]
ARCLVAQGDEAGSARVLDGLLAAPDSAETRRSAAFYRAYVHAFAGEPARGIALLESELRVDTTSGEVFIIPGDEAPLFSLVADAYWNIEQPTRAFDAWQLVVDANTGGPLQVFAIERAHASARMLGVAGWREIRGAGSLTRSAFAAPRIEQRLAAADLEGAAALVDELRADLIAYEQLETLALGEVGEWNATSGAPAIGVVLSLSGPNRRASRAALGAMLLAQRAFEEREPSVALLIEDTSGTTAGAERAVNALVERGATVILGPLVHDLVAPAARAADRRGVPLVSLSSAPSGGVLRWMISASQEAELLLGSVQSRHGGTRVAIVRDGSGAAYLDLLAGFATDIAWDRGMTVVQDVVVLSDPSDGAVLQASAALAARQVARSDADVVFLATTDDEAAAFAAYLTSEDVWPYGTTGRRQVSYLLGSFAASSALLLDSGPYVEQAFVASWLDPELASGEQREFVDRFGYTYGRDPGVIEAFAFDAAIRARQILVDERARSADAVRGRLLAATGDGGGAIGGMAFTSEGEPQVVPRLFQVVSEQFVPVAE